MHNGVITIFRSDFPPSDQSRECEMCSEEGVGARARASLSSSLRESQEGRWAAPEGTRPWPRKALVLETKEKGGGSGVRSRIKITQTCSP